MDKIQQLFEDSKKNILSGTIKFSTDYISYFQLFTAVSKWMETDKDVLSAALRGGGNRQIALDFRYDMSSKDKKGEDSFHTVIVPVFKDLLGGDYLAGWDYAEKSYIIK